MPTAIAAAAPSIQASPWLQACTWRAGGPCSHQWRRTSSGQTEAEDPQQPDQQAQPAHRVDRLAEERAGQQGHQQGLGIDQDRPEAGPALAQAPGQQTLEQAAVHGGEEQQPGQVQRVHPPGPSEAAGRQQQHHPGREQPQTGQHGGGGSHQQRFHRRHRGAPQGEGQEHQPPAQGPGHRGQAIPGLLFKIQPPRISTMPWPWRRKTRRTLARIAIEGPIAGGTRTRVLKAIEQVRQRECPALLLRIDSPGGTVGDSQEIHAALMRLREKGCRVVASFGNISASGGVYVGVAAERIVANPGTITGSIGVILRGNDLSRLLERIGIRFETVKSGLYKDILSPDRALSEAERQLLQELIDASYGQFVAAVAAGRGWRRRRCVPSPTAGSSPAPRPSTWAWWMPWATRRAPAGWRRNWRGWTPRRAGRSPSANGPGSCSACCRAATCCSRWPSP